MKSNRNIPDYNGVETEAEIPCLQASTVVSSMNFVEFLQYEEFFAFVSVEARKET